MRYQSLTFALILASAFLGANAQTPSAMDIGLQQYHDYDGGAIDHINTDTGNLTITIPLVSYPQRGSSLKMNFGVVYNGRVEATDHYCTTGTPQICETVWYPPDTPYHRLAYGQQLGAALYDLQSATSDETQLPLPDTHPQAYTEQVTFYTADGGSHAAGQISTGQLALDGSGWQTNLLVNNGQIPTTTCEWECTLPGIFSSASLYATHDGISYVSGTISGSQATARIDPDGNYILTGAGGITDTIGRVISGPVLNTSPTSSQTASCTGPLAVNEIAVWTPPGYSTPFTFCYANVTLAFEDVVNGIPVQTGSTVAELQSIVLPNGQTWTFEYQESLTNCPINTTNLGDLSQITLPTGGTISYTYQCYQASIETPNYTMVTSRTVNANDGTGSHTWTYQYNYNAPSDSSWVATTTDPLNNQTVATTTVVNSTNTTRVVQEYSGSAASGTLLRTDTRNYLTEYNQSGISPNTYPGPLFPTSEVTTLPTTLNNSISAQTAYQYCCNFTFTSVAGEGNYPSAASYGKVTDAKSYDYSGTLLKETQTAYEFQTNSNYLNPGFFDLVTSKTILDGNGNTVAQTSYAYDGSSRVTSGIAALTPSTMTSPLFGLYGHLTSKTDWLNAGSSNPVSTISYYDTGAAYQAVDPLGHTTSTYYCTGTSPTTIPCTASTYMGALPTVVVNPVSQQTSFSYRTDTGEKLSVTDANGQATNYSYGSDPLNRVTSISYPDGGQTSFQYNDSGNIGATITAKMSAAANKQTQYVVDGLGRISWTELLSDPEGPVYTLTTYDALGRKYKVWNPTRCNPNTQTSCPSEPTWGITMFGYDALSRMTSQIDSDGTSTEGWSYNGNQVTFTNENQNQWTRTSDALGRLTTVLEPNGSSASPSMETDYTYDALSNLKSVTQWGGAYGSSGARTRSFSYDSLSRLLQSNNSETGWVCYGTTGNAPANGSNCTSGYDADGNLQSKTDARGVTVGYAYDSLNRLVSKSYSNAPAGSLANCYQYDNSTTGANGIGRLWFEWTQFASCPTTPLSAPPASGYQSLRVTGYYDTMGRAVSEQQCVAGYCTSASVPSPPTSNCASLSGGNGLQYCYDLVGDLLAYGNGLTTAAAGSYQQAAMAFSQTYDAAGRLATMTSTMTDSTHPATLFSAPSYTPAEALSGWQLGGNLWTTRSYDSRLRLCDQQSGQLSSGQPSAVPCA